MRVWNFLFKYLTHSYHSHLLLCFWFLFWSGNLNSRIVIQLALSSVVGSYLILKLFFAIWLRIYFLLFLVCAGMCVFVCVYVIVVLYSCGKEPTEARGIRSSWSWSYKWLWIAYSRRAVCFLKPWVILIITISYYKCIFIVVVHHI